MARLYIDQTHIMSHKITNVIEGTMCGALLGTATVLLSPVVVPIYLAIKVADKLNTE